MASGKSCGRVNIDKQPFTSLGNLESPNLNVLELIGMFNVPQDPLYPVPD